METLLSVTIMGQESDASILLQKRENRHLPSRPDQPSSRERPTRGSSSHRSQFTLQASYKNTSHAFCQKRPAPTFPLTLSFSFLRFLLPFLSAGRRPILFPSSSPPTLKFIAKASQALHNRSPQNSASPGRRNGNPTAAKVG